MTPFIRFPHTPHLAWLGASIPRDDKVLTREEADAFLAAPIILEEKVDGANLGVSFDSDGQLRVQNRGGYLDPPFAGQFAGLGHWLDLRQDDLFDALGAELVLFGEWCAARHSLDYDRLPDWFVAFDVYDRAVGRFWSVPRRNTLATGLTLATVPAIDAGRYSTSALVDLVATATSCFRDGPLEGLYIRRDEGDWLVDRAKLVRSEFVQAIGEHWRSRAIEKNHLRVTG